MIARLQMRNITAFSDLDIEFSPRLNLIIGENGTGKTHLLKTAYGLCYGATLFKNKPEMGDDELAAELTHRFGRLFMPLDDKLGKIHRHGASEKAYLQAEFAQGETISTTFFNNSKQMVIQEQSGYDQYRAEAVFIPTKEVLSFMKGFTSLYEKYGLSFDQTYQDICLALDLPELRSEMLHEKSRWAMQKIEGICGGRFVFYGGGKVTFKAAGSEYSANSMAEGFRKAGILSRLLETGVIQPGISGPLFWDEPEANLNPILMRTLVEIMLELSRNGQQIVVATHDYVLLKWFDLLVDKGKGDHLRFHSLYRAEDSGRVALSSTDEYLCITPNPIDEAFGHLINQEIANDMGGLGK